MASQVSLEFYRQSQVGIALVDALDEMITEGRIDPQIAMQVLSQFDHSVAEALRNQVRSKATIKGKLHMYRYCDEMWTFVVENPTFKVDSENVTAQRLKIIACTPRPAGAADKAA